MALTYKEADEFIESFLAMRDGATDALASLAAHVYPVLNKNGKLIKAGARINWNGTIKRAAIDLWDTIENNPDNNPSLWEDIDYKEGYRVIPESLTVGTAFSKDEKGWWKDVLYISLIDNNVWTPDAYSTGWEIVK